MGILSLFSRKSDEEEISQEAETGTELELELDSSDLISDVPTEAASPEPTSMESSGLEADLESALSVDARSLAAAPSEPAPVQSPRMHEFEKFHTDFRNIVGNIEALTDALNKTRANLHETGAFLPSVESEFHRNAILETENTKLSDENLRKERQVKVIETAVSEKEAMLEAMKIREAELTSELEMTRKRLNDGRTSLAAAEENAQRLERELEKANSTINLSTETNLKLEHENEAVRERNTVLAADLSKSLKQESEVRRRYDEFVNRFDAETRRYQSMTSEYETAKRETARLQKERADLKTRLDAIGAEKSRLEEESNEMSNRLRGELYAQRSELNNLESRLRLFEQSERELHDQLAEAKHSAQNSDREKMTMRAELDSSRRELDSAKRELSAKTANLSEVNLRYMSDLMGLDYQKQQNEELKNSIKSLSAENQRLAQYQAMYKAAEEQISDMRAKLEAASRTPRTESEAVLPPDLPGSTLKH